MKKIKLSFLAIALMVATAVSAQVSFGIQGGVNVSNVKRSEPIVLGDQKIKMNPNFGFNFGILTDIGLTYNMGIRSGLFFTSKGYRLSEHNFIYEGMQARVPQFSLNLLYLQIPVHFAYKVDATSRTRVVLHAGPYLAYGIAGSRIVDGKRDGPPVFGSQGFKPFDIGLGLGAGAEFGRFLVGVGWDMGLLNFSRHDTISFRNQNAFATVGLRL